MHLLIDNRKLGHEGGLKIAPTRRMASYYQLHIKFFSDLLDNEWTLLHHRIDALGNTYNVGLSGANNRNKLLGTLCRSIFAQIVATSENIIGSDACHAEYVPLVIFVSLLLYQTNQNIQKKRWFGRMRKTMYTTALQYDIIFDRKIVEAKCRLRFVNLKHH